MKSTHMLSQWVQTAIKQWVDSYMILNRNDYYQVVFQSTTVDTCLRVLAPLKRMANTKGGLGKKEINA